MPLSNYTKNFILEYLFKKKILLDKLDKSLNLKNFIKRFNQNYINCDLVRIGGGGGVMEVIYCQII
jgi:hypothetical protein